MGFSTAPSDSGREEAIEMLLDRDPHGGYYRAAQAMVGDLLDDGMD
jgi:hypothetical protein